MQMTFLEDLMIMMILRGGQLRVEGGYNQKSQ